MHPSLELFQRADVHSLPVSPLSLLAAMKVPVLTYGQYSQAAGKSLSYLLGRFGPDGMTFPIDDRLTVFYNELNDPGRIRWTLAHELSHILLHYHPKKREPPHPLPRWKKGPDGAGGRSAGQGNSGAAGGSPLLRRQFPERAQGADRLFP